jgi:hypothetical protein
MATRAPAAQLLGRQRERDVLDRVLEKARDGHGGVLAVYGEPGIGKTALLDYAIEAGADFRVARTVGVEGEMELAFAALHQLCSPSLDLMERLPDPQRDAFEVALGLSAGLPPNPFLVGLAVLNLLSEAAEEQPLLCVVDDAQWLDRSSARVLAFVARRLLAEKIAMVFAAREPIGALAGAAELRIETLGWWRLPIRPATPRSSGGRPRSSGSRMRPRTPSSRTASSPSTRVWCFVIRSCGRRCTELQGRTSGATPTGRLRRRRTRRSIRTVVHGTGRRPRRSPTRTSPRSSSAPQGARRRVAASQPPRRSSNASLS